jgi:hypothetical protein
MFQWCCLRECEGGGAARLSGVQISRKAQDLEEGLCVCGRWNGRGVQLIRVITCPEDLPAGGEGPLCRTGQPLKTCQTWLEAITPAWQRENKISRGPGEEGIPLT